MNNNMIKNQIKALNKSIPIRIFFVTAIYFLISILTTIIIEMNQINIDIAGIVLSGFGAFFVGFIFLFIGFIQLGKKKKEKTKIIIDNLWKPYVDEITYPLSDTYDVYVEYPETPILSHPSIPYRASEDYYYTVKNLDAAITLTYLWVYSRSSNGQTTSTTTYFKGHFIETSIEQLSPIFIRADKWFNKVSSKFTGMGDYQQLDGAIINGTYTEKHKQIRNYLLSLGFKDVILLDKNNKLCVGLEMFKDMPKLKKFTEEEYEQHKSYIKQIIDAMEYLKQ